MRPVAPVNLVITSGEPAGVGPELSLAAALTFLQEQNNAQITILGDPSLFLRSVELGHEILGRLKFEECYLMQAAEPGLLNSANASYVLKMLDVAMAGCLAGRFAAMITAPLHKSIINDAGIPFTGHTEYLAKACGGEHVVMMLCAPLPAGFLGLQHSHDLCVALATTHLPLQAVSAALSTQSILQTIQIVHQDLQKKFGVANPVIRVAGLNPHAGELGYLGREEIEKITPAIALAQLQGIQVSGPYPGDTMFDAVSLNQVDAYIAMYHDQGLAPFKFVTFGTGVNVTLGLPIIRTSVDHGTALDIAGKGVADAGSMLEALRLAYQLALNIKENRS
jgi:4-hydroxythreonine-4-phosphate dehydrogenase